MHIETARWVLRIAIHMVARTCAGAAYGVRPRGAVCGHILKAFPLRKSCQWDFRCRPSVPEHYERKYVKKHTAALRACFARKMASSAGDGPVCAASIAGLGTGRELTEPCMPGHASAHCPSGGLIGLPTTLHKLASSIGTAVGRPICVLFKSPARPTILLHASKCMSRIMQAAHPVHEYQGFRREEHSDHMTHKDAMHVTHAYLLSEHRAEVPTHLKQASLVFEAGLHLGRMKKHTKPTSRAPRCDLNMI